MINTPADLMDIYVESDAKFHSTYKKALHFIFKCIKQLFFLHGQFYFIFFLLYSAYLLSLIDGGFHSHCLPQLYLQSRWT